MRVFYQVSSVACAALALGALGLYDAKTKRVHLPILIVAAILETAFIALWSPEAIALRLLAALASCLLFSMVFFAVKGSMGAGDPLLAAYIGLLLGPIGAWVALAAASLSGIAYALLSGKAKCRERIAFGPFAAACAILVKIYIDCIE
jgi:prepilin signal peptidase PulO-like enzyme (type II secretory pathway)